MRVVGLVKQTVTCVGHLPPPQGQTYRLKSLSQIFFLYLNLTIPRPLILIITLIIPTVTLFSNVRSLYPYQEDQGPDLRNILQLSYNNAKGTINLRRTSNLQNILHRTESFLKVRFACKVAISSEIFVY